LLVSSVRSTHVFVGRLVPLLSPWMEVRPGAVACMIFCLTTASSSFVGLAVMIVLIPVPAWVASLMQGVQKQKMKAVS
jgi:hypothetical protein